MSSDFHFLVPESFYKILAQIGKVVIHRYWPIFPDGHARHNIKDLEPESSLLLIDHDLQVSPFKHDLLGHFPTV